MDMRAREALRRSAEPDERLHWSDLALRKPVLEASALSVGPAVAPARRIRESLDMGTGAGFAGEPDR
jgi:hypothetical protein